MRLLICAGMTGGGVYPAIAVLQALKGRSDEVLWLGSRSGMEETMLEQYDLTFEAVSAAGLHGVSLQSLPGNINQLLRGLREANAIIKRFKPQVLFFTGGYLGVPVAFAGRKIPSVVFIPDIEPGLALKAILRFARSVAVSTKKSLRFLKGKRIEVTGYPIRSEMTLWDRTSARKHFAIPENEPALLVFGGSKGLSINKALYASLGSLLDMHVILSAVKTIRKTETRTLDPALHYKYHAYPFLHDEMGCLYRGRLGSLSSASTANCHFPTGYAGAISPCLALPATPSTGENGSAVILADPGLMTNESKVRDVICNRNVVVMAPMKTLSSWMPAYVDMI
jgi:UDP-N-acetylglucosamine--N-acetylmuramyl-(pentapeptide) pyrophosphoryl-undecaprenol N-acetylglucosamine transferase